MGSGQSSFLIISKLWLSWVKMSTTELENRACSDVCWNCRQRNNRTFFYFDTNKTKQTVSLRCVPPCWLVRPPLLSFNVPHSSNTNIKPTSLFDVLLFLHLIYSTKGSAPTSHPPATMQPLCSIFTALLMIFMSQDKMRKTYLNV